MDPLPSHWRPGDDIQMRPLTGLTLLAFLVGGASEAAIVYQFAGEATSLSGATRIHAFQLTLPNFFDPGDSPELYPCASLDSSINCGLGAILFRTGDPEYPDSIQFDDSDTAGYLYEFKLGALTSVGSFPSRSFGNPDLNSGFLTVSLSFSESAVPEPATFVPAALALIAIAGRARSRRPQRAL
jgi:hypothetical protein